MTGAKKIGKKLSILRTASKGLGILSLLCLVLLWSPARLWAASADINVSVCYPASAPIITSPADGTQTTQSSILVSGTAAPNKVVYAYRNSVQVGFVTSGGDGSFTISVSLNMGSNSLTTGSKNDCNEVALSSAVSVERLAVNPPPATVSPAPNPAGSSPPHSTRQSKPKTKTPPAADQSTSNQPATKRPIILNPKDGTRVTDPDILVNGTTSPRTTVHILLNGKLVAEVLSDDNGWFAVSITLALGKNKIVASVNQATGNLDSPATTVIYQNPSSLINAKRSSIAPILVFIGLLSALLLLILYLILHTREGHRLWLFLKSHKRKSK